MAATANEISTMSATDHTYRYRMPVVSNSRGHGIAAMPAPPTAAMPRTDASPTRSNGAGIEPEVGHAERDHAQTRGDDAHPDLTQEERQRRDPFEAHDPLVGRSGPWR